MHDAASDDYDEEIREKLVAYLNRTVSSECKAHIEETHLFGSLVEGRFTRESDVDVFFVIDEYEYPAKGDINMVCLSNVPEAVGQGLGRQRGEWWTGRKEWGKGPDEVADELPTYIIKSMRTIIAAPFSTSQSQRWVDVYFGSKSHLRQYANATEQHPFP